MTGPGAPAPTASTVSRAVSWMAAAQVVGQATSFGALLTLGALLPPLAFGTVTTGVLLVTVATLLMGAGTSGSIVSTRHVSPGDVRRGLVLNVALGAALTVVIWFLAGPMTRNFSRGGDPAVLQALAVCLLLYSFSIVPGAMLQKRMQFRRYAVSIIGSTTISSVAAVIAGIAGAGVWALVIRQVLYYAVLAALTWWMARHLFAGAPLNAEPVREAAVGRSGRWFLLLSAADFVAFNADFLVIGRLTDATRLGTYSLAFTLAFLPLRQFAWQVGGVLFAASAAIDDPDEIGRRMLRALRITAVLLLPVLPPTIVLAPWLLPALLGERWADMVTPFQILLVVGVGHALTNVIGEFLSGTGNVAFRARTSVAWAAGMVLAMVVLVSALGIRGAALAHALLFVPLATAYAFWGCRRLGVTLSQLGRSLCDIALPVGAQALATAAVAAGLARAGLNAWAADSLGAAVGVGVVMLLLLRTGDSALRDAVSLVTGGLGHRRRG